MAKISKQLPNPFGEIPKDKNALKYFPNGFNIRNDCKLGCWKIGESSLIQGEIDFCVISLEEYYGYFGDSRATNWLQLWFVCFGGNTEVPENLICNTLIKGLSKKAFGQLCQKLLADTINPLKGIFSPRFVVHQSSLGAYYSLDWSWKAFEEEDKAFEEKVLEFLETGIQLKNLDMPDSMVALEGWNNSEVISEINALKEKRNLLIEAKK